MHRSTGHLGKRVPGILEGTLHHRKELHAVEPVDLVQSPPTFGDGVRHMEDVVAPLYALGLGDKGSDFLVHLDKHVIRGDQQGHISPFGHHDHIDEVGSFKCIQRHGGISCNVGIAHGTKTGPECGGGTAGVQQCAQGR